MVRFFLKNENICNISNMISITEVTLDGLFYLYTYIGKNVLHYNRFN